MPVIFPVIKNVLSDAVGKAIASAQRYFLSFDPVLNSYAELDTAFTPAGDFELEATVSTTNTTSTLAILSGSIQSTDTIILQLSSGGFVQLFAYVGGVQQKIISSGVVLNDGKLHSIKVKYTGTTAQLFTDGVSHGTATWALNGSQDLNFIGFRPTFGRYFDGIIADVKLIDKTTASNSRIFPLAVGAGATENSTINTGSITIYNIPDVDRELFTFDDANDRWVGEELVTNGTFDTDSDWTKGTGWSIGDGKATHAAGSVSSIFQNDTLIDGRVHLSVLELLDRTQGDTRIRLGSSSTQSGKISTNGIHEFKGVASGTTLTIRSLDTLFDGSIDNVSVKRILEVA